MSIQCYIQLRRPSDGVTSEALPFEYLPLDSGRRSKKRNFEFLNQLLANHTTSQNNGSNAKNSNNNITSGTVTNSPVTEVIDLVHDDDMSPSSNVEILQSTDVQMQESSEQQPSLANTKTNEWITKTEFQLNEESGGGGAIAVSDEDKTLHELLEQVADLDEIYTDHQLRKDNVNIENELNGFEKNLPQVSNDGNAEFDELFDDAATYSSLQIAFKNPIAFKDAPPRPPPYNNASDLYDAVEPPVHTSATLFNPLAPMIDVSSPLKRDSPPIEEEKLPPLPPKRVKKTTPQPENNENTEPINLENHTNDSLASNSNFGSSKSLQQRPASQIIIMKTPNASPLHKKLPPTPTTNSYNAKQEKKPGFLSKLFSRRKSKPDIGDTDSYTRSVGGISVEGSREPSVQNFAVTLDADNLRASTRSNKSLQIPAQHKVGKKVGRSVSSVSGKRPHLTADIVHIPLKGGSTDSLAARSGSGAVSLPGNRDAYERASTATLSNNLDRKTVSALQLADLPLQEGNMELIAIADRQSLKNLCEGEYGVHLDPSVDLTEAEHYALYTSVAPHATQSEFDEASCYYAPVEAGEILTQEEVARRLAGNFS